MDQLRDDLIQQLKDCGVSVPSELLPVLSPAVLCLKEWQGCWLEIPGADSLRVGQERLAPVRGCLFHLRLENYLGLARVQPYADGAPLCAPVTVEVISPKFPSAREHVGFFKALLEDLFARSARLPFDLEGPTERGVSESLQPPTPLSVLHFLSQHADSLRDALALVQARPHRYLADRTEQVPLVQASQADPDVLQDIVRSPERWVRTERDLVLTRRMKGYGPTAIRHRSGGIGDQSGCQNRHAPMTRRGPIVPDEARGRVPRPLAGGGRCGRRTEVCPVGDEMCFNRSTCDCEPATGHPKLLLSDIMPTEEDLRELWVRPVVGLRQCV